MPRRPSARNPPGPPPAEAPEGHFVFISYANVNREVAETLCQVMEARGVRCWIAPRDVQPGREWRPSIIEAIERCQVMVLVFSDEANRSPQVSREVEVAFDEKKTIIPFRVDATEMNRSLRYCISATHWLDALTPPLSEHAQRLASTVVRLMADPAPASPAASRAAGPPPEPAPAAPPAGMPLGEGTEPPAPARAGKRAPRAPVRPRRPGRSGQTRGRRRATAARRARAWAGRFAVPVALAGVLLLMAIGVWSALRPQRPAAGDSAAALAEGPVVAVLPFVDRSPGRDEAWRADELSAEIITALARLPAMRVVARSSAFAFRDSSLDVREIGRRLGARFVLEGSVGRVGSQLRVEALLVSVDRGYQVWSGSFAREPQDALALQDEIARGIVGVLRPREDAARGAPARRPTTDPEAYDLFLRARHLWGQRTAEGLEGAMGLLAQALRRDPSFAHAHAGVAECHALLVGYGALPPAQGYPLARAAAERALALDSAQSQAHAVLALVKQYHDRDWAGAGREFALAIRADPANVTARRWHAMYLAYQGRSDEAMRALEEAQRLDPFSAPVHTTGSTILYFAGRYDEAIDRGTAALVIDPTFWPARAQITSAYAQQGRFDEALAEAERIRTASGGHPAADAYRGYLLARSASPDSARAIIRALEARRSSQYLSPIYIAIIHASLGENDAAMTWLQRAFDEHDDFVLYLPVDPAFRPLRADPRFRALLRRIQADG